jgi:hypothetical protein
MIPKYHVYGSKPGDPPMKVKYRDIPLPEDLNQEAEEKAEKFGYPPLLEIVKEAKRRKWYGIGQFYLNGIEIANFHFWFGICMRVEFAQGDIGDKYADIKAKLTKAHGQLIPIAMFMRSLVPEAISTIRPHEDRYARPDRKSEDFKKAYLNGEV